MQPLENADTLLIDIIQDLMTYYANAAMHQFHIPQCTIL